MEDEIEQGTEETTEEATEEATTEETTEETKPETKAEKAKETPEAKKARLIRELKRVSKQLGDEEEAPSNTKTKSDRLDETQLDYLDLKGITDSDEIALIEKIVLKTGQTVREALKDDYVTSKLETMRQEKAVRDATPGNTKRSGGGNTDALALALARYEANGDLPSDYALRSQVVNAIVDKNSSNKPAWH